MGSESGTVAWEHQWVTPEFSRRSFLTSVVVSATAGLLTACVPWGRRNAKPSPEAEQAITSLAERLRDLPGVDTVEVSFKTKAMQKHEIVGNVVLLPDLTAADLTTFGTGAHAAVLDHQVDPYFTHVWARGTFGGGGKIHWPIRAESVPAGFGAAVDAMLGELSRGARSCRITEPNEGSHETDARLSSEWADLDEAALLAATPAGVAHVSRHLDPHALGDDYTSVTVGMPGGQPAMDLPYRQAITDLTPVLQSSGTTLGSDFRRWSVQFRDQTVAAPELVSAVTAFLRTLRGAGLRWDEIELQYPWHVTLSLDGRVRVKHWIDGNSDRAAAEPVVTEVVAAANRD